MKKEPLSMGKHALFMFTCFAAVGMLFWIIHDKKIKPLLESLSEELENVRGQKSLLTKSGSVKKANPQQVLKELQKWKEKKKSLTVKESKNSKKFVDSSDRVAVSRLLLEIVSNARDAKLKMKKNEQVKVAAARGVSQQKQLMHFVCDFNQLRVFINSLRHLQYSVMLDTLEIDKNAGSLNVKMELIL